MNSALNQDQWKFSTDVDHLSDPVSCIRLQQDAITRMRNPPCFRRPTLNRKCSTTKALGSWTVLTSRQNKNAQMQCIL